MKKCEYCDSSGVKFGSYANSCVTCQSVLARLRCDGFSLEDAKFKLKCGLHYDGKVVFWNIMLEKAWNK